MTSQPNKFLLHGIDTLQCAYFLIRNHVEESIDFAWLAHQKEIIQQSKSKSPAAVTLAGVEFLLLPHGSSSGYPYILENGDFKIELGEFNSPNFYVTFRSQALWRESAWLLHAKFIKWAAKAGFAPYREESLSRVDFSFDYLLPHIDFDENSFVSRSTKDSQYRENGSVQTFSFGKGDIVLRVYDKIAEIQQQSSKVWFYLLWHQDQNVWRFEWQLRKKALRKFDIQTFEHLKNQQGDILYYLVTEHDTLRIPTTDKNRSRWPLHPIWQDLQGQIENLNNLGVHRIIGQPSALEERMQRISISLYGYLKRVAAITCIQEGRSMTDHTTALNSIIPMLNKLYEPMAWEADVEKRIKEMQLGQW